MSDYDAALKANGWSITKIGNNIELPHIMLGMRSAHVEIYDMRNGFFLFFEASRSDLTFPFTILVQRSKEMQAMSNNQHGTVQIAAAQETSEKDIKVWVKKLH